MLRTQLLLLLFFTICKISNAQSLFVYPFPSNSFQSKSSLYLLYIKQNDSIKQSFVYESRAGTGAHREWGIQQNKSFHYSIFSFSGSVTLEIVKLNSVAGSAIIRPNYLGLGRLSTKENNSAKYITLTLNRPAKLSVEFDDDPHLKDVLVIFADTLEVEHNVPNLEDKRITFADDLQIINNIPKDKSIVYFKPGIYKIGYWQIPIHIEQIYIAGGAFVYGYLHRTNWSKDSNNTIKINGRGIISNQGWPYHYPSKADISENASTNWYKAISLQGGQNHIIEGITIVDPTSYNVLVSGDNMLIKNIKINGFRFNNDGITISGRNNKIEECFIRTADDAIVLYSSNLIVKDCIFWQLHSSIFQLGWTPHSMKNIMISGCDVLHAEWENSGGNIGFINAMNYTQPNESAQIENVLVTNIRFDTPISRFLDIRRERGINRNDIKSITNPIPWIYKNFYFKDIHFNQLGSDLKPLIFLHGHDSEHPISNFIFENIYLNKIKLSEKELLNSSLLNTQFTKSIIFQ